MLRDDDSNEEITNRRAEMLEEVMFNSALAGNKSKLIFLFLSDNVQLTLESLLFLVWVSVHEPNALAPTIPFNTTSPKAPKLCSEFGDSALRR